MPEKQFLFAPANPMRPISNQEMASCASYYHPYQKSDSTKLQVLSDWVPTGKIVDFYSRQQVAVMNWLEVPTNIVGQTFKAYEAEISWNINSGIYQVQIFYTNDAAQVITTNLHPVEVQDTHPDTLLITYTNSYNTLGIVFDTDIVFTLRIQGIITEYQPLTDKLVYNDQLRNATLLDAIPYDSYRLKVGGPQGLPEWMRRKLNLAFSCNQKTIDGIYYEALEGEKWETERVYGDFFAELSILIMPVENVFLQSYTTGPLPPDGYTPVSKVKNYNNNGADLTVVGIFKAYSLLEKIAITNKGIAFTLNIGLTPGGSEIGSFTVAAGAVAPNQTTATLLLNYLFKSTTTVYLSGLAGTDTDISFVYDQLDEPTIPLGLPQSQQIAIPPPGSVWIYSENAPGDGLLDWNFTTGLGRVGTAYEGCAICDGRNGTQQRGKKFPRGFLAGDPECGTLYNQTGGFDTVTLIKANLPVNNVNLPNSSVAGRSDNSNDRDVMIPTAQQTINVGGSGTPFASVPSFITSLFVQNMKPRI